MPSPKSLILSLSIGLLATTAFGSTDPILTKVGNAVQNIHAVEASKIYRGARPGDSGIEALAQAGIRTIVDLQGGDDILGIPVEAGESKKDIAEEGAVAVANGIHFVSVPMSAINPDMDDQTGRINEVLSIIEDPASQPVFFHCRHGSDRTGLIAALYRVFVQGCTPAQAHQEMMKYGHSSMLFWMDNYFNDRVSSDPNVHQTQPAPSCPL